MRTTVELPPALLRAAKARSAERGESLKSLFTRALETELGERAATPGQARRVSLPLFGAAPGPLVRVTNADLERALADEDTRRTGTRPRRRARRSLRR